MKKIISIFTLILSGVVAVMAQAGADSYLDKVVTRFRNAPGVTAQFTLKGDAQSGMSMQGELKMKGKKFVLSTQDLTTWYDGKTMWTYAVGMQEVNITEPTRQELTEINPYILLDTYKQSFTVKELTVQHKGERRFELVPTKRNTSISRIILTVATATMSPISFEIADNNRTILVAITNYNDTKPLPDATFKFDASQYKDVEIVDLR